jgi:hypothetical protein
VITSGMHSEVDLERCLLPEEARIQRGGLGGFLLSSSFSSLIGSRPSTNGVGMGFYHLPLEVEFPRAPDPPKGHPRVVPIGCGIYEAVRGRMSLDLLSFFSSCMQQPRRTADKEGDNVMAVAERWL